MDHNFSCHLITNHHDGGSFVSAHCSVVVVWLMIFWQIKTFAMLFYRLAKTTALVAVVETPLRCVDKGGNGLI